MIFHLGTVLLPALRKNVLNFALEYNAVMNALKAITFIINGFFSNTPHYTPIIPPYTRAQMDRNNISEKELIGVFNSKDIKKG